MIADLLILLFAVSSFYRGHALGLTRQICAAVGFIGGLFVGVWLQPLAAKLASNPVDHTLITISCTLGIALIGLLLGESLGIILKGKLPLGRLSKFDNLLGSITNIVTLLLGVWLLAALANNLAIPPLRNMLQESKIVSGLNKILPPAPQFLNNLGKLIDPNGFPQVFIGNEPAPAGNVDLPSLGVLRSAVESSQASVVKIEGVGCGGIVDGSGFIVNKDLIATNAHVIAGIKQPFFADRTGTYKATPVYFDAKLDFALLRSSQISAKALPVATSKATNGTPAVVLGYPGGGAFTAEPAAIMNTLLARGRDIYGEKVSLREIYELRANVEQGNSGGPVLNKDGQVIGVVFAESSSYEQVGYALTSPTLLEAIAKANQNPRAVSTGQCADE
jgi:S1-C subfamily serine protease